MSTSRSEASFTFLQAYPGNPQLGDALPFLYRSATARVEGLSTGANNRNVLLDPARPGRAYLISRAPESMLTVQFDPAAPTRVQVVDAVPLPPGPSRLAFVPGARPMVLAVSYDARQVTLVDLGAQRVVGQVLTNRGPHTVVVDPRGPWAYVLDFLDAAVEVIDLRPEVDGAANRSYLRRVLTLGTMARDRVHRGTETGAAAPLCRGAKGRGARCPHPIPGGAAKHRGGKQKGRGQMPPASVSAPERRSYSAFIASIEMVTCTSSLT